MKNNQSLLLKFLPVLLFAAICGHSALSVNAQYGNLISKAAADALAAGDSQPCEKEMKSLLAREPKNAAAHIELGRCIYLATDRKDARERLIKSHMSEGATRAEAEANADVNYDAAILNIFRTINDAESIDRNYSPAYNLSGLVARMQGNSEYALKQFSRAIELDPKNYRAYANRGKTKDDAGDAAGAIADYEKVGALGVNDPFIAKRLPELKKKSAQPKDSQAANLDFNLGAEMIDFNSDFDNVSQNESKPRTAEEYLEQAEKDYRNKYFFFAVWNVKKAIDAENAKKSNEPITADSGGKKSAAVLFYEKMKSESDPLDFKYWEADLKEFNKSKRLTDEPDDNSNLRNPNIVGLHFYRGSDDKWQDLSFVLVKGINKLQELNVWDTVKTDSNSKTYLRDKYKQSVVVILNKKTKVYEVWNVVAVEPKKMNLELAATDYRRFLNSDSNLTLSFEARRLNFGTALVTPPKNFFSDQEIVDILDADGLSLVTPEKLPDQRGDKGITEVFEREVKNGNLREAKQTYAYFSRITEQSSGLDVVKSRRKFILNKLYKTKNADLQKFVEEEMTKWNYTEEDKKVVRGGR